MSAWSRVSRRWGWLCGIGLAGSFAVLVGSIGSYFDISDVGLYVQLARGQGSSVMQPAASRQLGPAVVRLLAWLLHWPVERAFVLQGVVSLLLILLVSYGFIVKTAAPRWVLVATALVPFWPQLFHGLVLPDLWFAALLSLFLVLLAKNHFLLAACMMFPLMVSRESTSLVLLCFLLAGWRRLRWMDKGAAVVAAIAGSMLVQRLAALGPGNREHLPEAVYMVTKVPWNLLRNVAGIVPWSNVYPLLCPAPVWQHSLHVGSVRTIGVCGFASEEPIQCAVALLTTFGLLPLLAGFLWWRNRRKQQRSMLMLFCLLYGAVSFVLAPALGVWFTRLYGYGWPLFLIALPMLFDELPGGWANSGRAAAGVAFACLHVVACALAFCLFGVRQIVFGSVLWIAGFFLLRWWFGPAEDARDHSALMV